jgi:hypothetical protein
MPIILATWEAEIKRTEVQENLSQKYPTQNRVDGVAQAVEHLPSKLTKKVNTLKRG